MKVRQAVIMVGGKGTRLRPLTETCPKPILPVAGKPCIWYLMRSMARAGVEEIILACGYRSGMMSQALGDGSDIGVRIRYTYEDEPMGTGGALKLIEDQLDPVFIASNGDVFADIDLKGEVERHFESGADVTVALTPVPNPWEFGVARIADDGSILEFKEGLKPDQVFSNLINAGVYVVDKRVMAGIPEGQFYDFSKELFPKIIAEGGKLMSFPLSGIWMDVGRPSDYVKANLCVASGNPTNKGAVKGGAVSGKSYVGDGAVISDSVLIDAVVMDGALVERSRLTRVVVLPGCTIRGATIDDSIIGAGCMINEGAAVSNSVLGDRETVEIGETRDDGRDV